MSVELNNEVIVPVPMVDIASIISQILVLSTNDKWKIAESVLANIKGEKSVKTKKAKKDPNAPKRPLATDSYMYLVNKSVWPIIKSLADAETDAEVKKWYNNVKTRTFVSQAIWEPIKGLASEERVQKISNVKKDEVIALLNKYKETPVAASGAATTDADEIETIAEKPKTKAPRKSSTKKEKVEKAEESGAESSSDEEKTTKVKKERKKSEKKGAEKPKEKEPEPVVAAKDDVEVVPYAWEHDFGKGAITYERVDFEGMAYIYDLKSKEYLGAYMEKTNKLNKKVADPTA